MYRGGVAALTKREDRPWPEWKHGQPLTTRQLAKLLAPFGIGPRVTWSGSKSARGYQLQDFDDAFARYLPSVNASGANKSAALRVISSVNADRDLTHPPAPDAAKSADADALTDETRGRLKPGMRE